MESRYNPFKKYLSEIREEDLKVLFSVAEGWFVEYKRERISASNIAKAISSFANSHGGIFFLGIEENKDTNCAKDFPGIKEDPDIVRDALVGNLSHVPEFTPYSIKLKNGKRVLMISVPEGTNPPYIHSSGKIYRRHGAGSDPVPETNKFIIDGLYNKSKNHQKELEQFRKNNFEFTRHESESPHLLIYLAPIPFKRFLIEDFKKIDGKGLLKFFSKESRLEEGGAKLSFNMPFDTFSTYSNSFTVRAMIGKDLNYNGLTIEIDVFGNCKILIPLNNHVFSEKSELEKRYMDVLKKYDKESLDNLKIINGSQTGHVVLTILNLYKEFLLERGFANDLEITMELMNCHRTTVYFESDDFLNHIEQCGISPCMKDNQCFPSIPFFWENKRIKKNSLINCLSVFSQAMMGLGIPTTITSMSYITSLKPKLADPQSPSSNQSPPDSESSPLDE